MESSKITKTLIFASILAIVLDIGRGDILQDTGLAYLVWNLFLAWIPYLISSFLIKKNTSMSKFVPLFILWMIFFPNAPYMVTDIIHVASPLPHVLWYDSLVFFFFALVSLILGMTSLSNIEKYLSSKIKNNWWTEISVLAICALGSFGIYLGRFERWNSWDLFLHPSEIAKHSYAISTNLSHPSTPLMFIFVFTIFIYCTYKLFSVFLKKETL